MSKVIECLEQNIRKQIDCKRLPNTKQMNRLQNTRIEIWKYKAVRKYKLVLAVFVSAICTNIALNYIKQTRYN